MKRFKKDLGFAKILSSQEISGGFEKNVRKAFSLNKRSFKRVPKKFNIIICHDEKEFKKEMKYYYEKWATATVRADNTFVIRNIDLVEKVGIWKKKDFQNLMNHELNHVFWVNFYERAKPSWLYEGLACYVGNNFILSDKELRKVIKKYKIDSSILDYRYLERKVRKGHYPRYPVWAGFTKFIAKKYSVNKLIKLMDKFIKNPKKDNYKKLFKNMFGKFDRELFDEFCEAIN